MFCNRQRDFELSFFAGSWRIHYGLLLAALTLLLMAVSPSAQAQGRCYAWDGTVYFRMPSGGFISGSQDLYDNRDCSPPSAGSISFGKYGAVDVLDRADAISKCNSNNGYENTVSPYGPFWSCKPIIDTATGKKKRRSGGSSDSDSGGASEPTSWIERSMAGVNVAAEGGMFSGIQFKRLEAFHIGIKHIIDRGVLDVVDVFGNANQYFEVCFPQAGIVVFLDAATSPRTPYDIPTFVKDNYTCAAMNRAGTMVLLHAPAAAATDSDAAADSDAASEAEAAAKRALAQAFINATTDPVSSAIELDDCEVISVHNLNLRESPWGKKLSVLPKNTTATAIARTESWFKITFELTADKSIEGWIAAWLSEGDGACDWEQDSGDVDSPALASNQPAPALYFLSVT